MQKIKKYILFKQRFVYMNQVYIHRTADLTTVRDVLIVFIN